MFVEVKPDSFESIIIAWMRENFPDLHADPVIGGVDFFIHDSIFLVHVSPKMHVIRFDATKLCSFEHIEVDIADPNYFSSLKELVTSQLKRIRIR